MISVYVKLTESEGQTTGRAEAERPGVTFDEAIDAGLDAFKAALVAAGFSAGDFNESVRAYADERAASPAPRTPTSND